MEVDSSWVGAKGKVCDTKNDLAAVRLRPLPGSTVFNADKIEFSNDSRWMMRANYECLLLHDMQAPGGDKEKISIHAVADWATAVAMSPDSKRVATGGRNGEVRVVDLAGETQSLRLVGKCTPNARVDALALSPDGRWLAAGDSVGLTRIWDLTAPRPGSDFSDRICRPRFSRSTSPTTAAGS